ncbi:MAG: FxsA family protein [Kiloniellales bacterium]|nr:FxsA family protein [Kiloniellales bacterium]
MGLILFLLFLLVPLIEIGVFIEVGGLIGLLPTLGLILLTAVLGTWQLRAQGLSTLARARQQMEQGQLPAQELYDGFCLIIAGALLLTPGFVTDAVGFALFVPAFRRLLRRVIAERIRLRTEVRMRRQDERGSTTIIEGEFREVPDDHDPLPGRGGKL